MAESSAASLLRLSSARRRIDAFLEQIDVLAASSFPHKDGERALAGIRRHCEELRQQLELPAGTRGDVIDTLCQSLLDSVADYTEILGFILRSTNVRNPFELHFVVKKLVTMALGEEVSLLISSEWDYNPFTYPMNIEQLPDAILIGTPAPETSNPLLIPLAGHEVGHSAWRVYACTPLYSKTVIAAVRRTLEQDPNAKKDLVQTAPLRGLDIDRVVNRCAAHVMKQLEETFCDLFGLFLFAHAYVAAFDYLLGPGSNDRDLDYPSDGQRMRFMADAARELGIPLDVAMIDSWIEPQPNRADRPMARIADAVTATIVPEMRSHLFVQLRAKGLERPDETSVAVVLDAFRNGEPHADRVELGVVISAGWRRLRELDDLAPEGIDPGKIDELRRKSYRVLADLVLKTVEIAEYHDRLAVHA